MQVKVKYFASLRERLGKAEDIVQIEQGTTVQKLWDSLTDELDLSEQIKTAVNQEYVNPDTPLNDNDEVAFFPPVTGG